MPYFYPPGTYRQPAVYDPPYNIDWMRSPTINRWLTRYTGPPSLRDRIARVTPEFVPTYDYNAASQTTGSALPAGMGRTGGGTYNPQTTTGGSEPPAPAPPGPTGYYDPWGNLFVYDQTGTAMGSAIGSNNGFNPNYNERYSPITGYKSFSYQGPRSRRSGAQAGSDFGRLNEYQRQQLADQMGITVEELAQRLAGPPRRTNAGSAFSLAAGMRELRQRRQRYGQGRAQMGGGNQPAGAGVTTNFIRGLANLNL